MSSDVMKELFEVIQSSSSEAEFIQLQKGILRQVKFNLLLEKYGLQGLKNFTLEQLRDLKAGILENY